MKHTLLALGLALLLSQSAHAAGPQMIRLAGSSTTIKKSGLKPGAIITLYGVSRGNSTNPIKIKLTGIQGVSLTADAARVEGSASLTLSRAESFYPVPLRTNAELKSADQLCVQFAKGVSEDDSPDVDLSKIQPMWAPVCELYSREDLLSLSIALAQTYGGSWPIERACGYLVAMYQGGAGDGDVTGGEDSNAPKMARLKSRSIRSNKRVSSEEYRAIFQKDACGAPFDQYIFRLSLTLPSKLPSNPYLRVGIFETRHYGSKAATIKPISEGKYKPAPLLMMSALGFCGQELNIVRWSGGKPLTSTKARVFDLITYQDLVLTRTPFMSYLTGGAASIELYDRDSGYGACFNLVRERQRVNGYPG